MDIHDTQEHTGERLFVSRHGAPHTAMPRSMPSQADNTYGTSRQIPHMYDRWSFRGIDRNSNLANTDSHHSPDHSSRQRHSTVHSLGEGYELGKYTQRPSIYSSQKRVSDVDDIGANPHKRYRLSSPDQLQIFGDYLDDTKSGGYQGVEDAQNYECDGESSYRMQNIEHRYHAIPQPQRQAVNASRPQASLLPPGQPHANDNVIRRPCSPTKQGGYSRIPHQPSRARRTPPRVQNMTYAAYHISSNQELNAFSPYGESLLPFVETSLSHTSPAPRILSSRPQPLQSGMTIRGSPQKSNSSTILPITKVPHLGSPLWKNSSERHASKYGQPRERPQVLIDQDRGMSQIRSATPNLENSPSRTSAERNPDIRTSKHQDSSLSYDIFAAKEHRTSSTAQSGVALDVMETSRRILTQISKDSDSRNEISIHQMPLSQKSSTRRLAAPVYADQDALHRIRDPSKRLPQSQSASQKLDDTIQDSDGSDSTPIVHLFERLRYDQPRSQTDFSRSPYKVTSVLPRTGISYKERPIMKTTVPQIGHIRQFSGDDPNSPICVDSPPRSPIRIPLILESVPMSARLSPPKVKPNSKAKIDPNYDKQRRAAELIIRREREVLEKEIFGEVVGDTFQMNDEEAKFTRTELRQMQDSKENARLLKEEMQKTKDLEIKRLQNEAAEREQRRKQQEEESKRAKREVERKKQAAIEETQKEERRRMAHERIEASRLKEIADREKKEQVRQKAISIQSDAAKRTEMELRREITKLQAASLKSATVFPSSSKKSTGRSLLVDAKEDSLFVPETNQSRQRQDSCYGRSSDRSSNYDVDGRYKADTTRPRSKGEVFARRSNFRSRLQQERDELEARRKAEAEGKRRELLKAKLTAFEYEKGSEKRSMHESISRKEVPKDSRRNDCTARNSNTKSFDVAKERCNIVPDVHSIPKNRQRTRSRRSDQQNEARRKRDGERARDNHRRRLLEEAEEGGYTITADEMNKRLDAYMKKREENYQKKKSRQSFEPDHLIPNADVDPEHESITELHAPVIMHSPHPAEPEQVKDLEHEPVTKLHPPVPTQSRPLADLEEGENNKSNTDPDQEERDRSALYMKEAIKALAKNNNRGSRFAETAAKRTVFALQLASETSSESDESEEDPDDDPAPGPISVGREDQIGGNPKENNQGEGEKENVNVPVQFQQAETVADESVDSADLPPNAQQEDDLADISTEPNESKNAKASSISKGLSEKEPTTADNQLVRVYVVRMLKTVDGEDSSPQDLNKLLSLSDANTFAEGKIKEYHSNDDISITKDYLDQLFQAQITHNENNSIQIWVESEIKHPSKAPNFDPKLLKSRFPANSWLIRFETVKDVFNQESQTWSTHTTSSILPDHHYSDLELANYAACDYLIKFLKPSRPVLDHLEQYENEFIPELRRARDGNCEQKVPFQCGIEKSESQAQWITEKEVTTEVVCYQMRGPLN